MSFTTTPAQPILMEAPAKASWSDLPLELKEKIIKAFLDDVLDKLEFGRSKHIDTGPYKTLGDVDPADHITNECYICLNAIRVHSEKQFARNVATLARSSPSSMIGLITQVATRMRKETYKLISRGEVVGRCHSPENWFYQVHFERDLLCDVAFESNPLRLLLETPKDDKSEIVMGICDDDDSEDEVDMLGYQV